MYAVALAIPCCKNIQLAFAVAITNKKAVAHFFEFFATALCKNHRLNIFYEIFHFFLEEIGIFECDCNI